MFSFLLIGLDVDHSTGALHSSISFGMSKSFSPRYNSVLIAHQVPRQNGHDRFAYQNGKRHPLDRELRRLKACLRLHSSMLPHQTSRFFKTLTRPLPSQSLDFYRTMYAIRDTAPLSIILTYSIGNVILNGLNVFWFMKMIASVRKRSATPPPPTKEDKSR